jgi:hypothetical protein
MKPKYLSKLYEKLNHIDDVIFQLRIFADALKTIGNKDGFIQLSAIAREIKQSTEDIQWIIHDDVYEQAEEILKKK